MTKLLKYFKPYIGLLSAMLVLLILQCLSDLYLPNLNADIINFGVIKGDTDYIWRTGGYMLLITFLRSSPTSRPATSRPAPRWRSAGIYETHCSPRLRPSH